MGFIGKNAAKSIVFCKNNGFRYYLEINVSSNPVKPVIVIMKNPSSTCNNLQANNNTITSYIDKKKCHIDRTTGRVYRFLKNQYDKIIILNLFALYTPYPSVVGSYYFGPASNSHHQKDLIINNTKINNTLKSNPTAPIICAWGANSAIPQKPYNSCIMTIEGMIKNRTLLQYDINQRSLIAYHPSKNYPPHGLMWK